MSAPSPQETEAQTRTSDAPEEAGALLEDAKLVIGYAARTGRLSDNGLQQAADDVANGIKTRSLRSEQVIGLTQALNEAIKTIAPVSLLDLGSKWVPFPNRRKPRRFLFAALLFLVVITAYFTQLHSQANAVLVALKDVQSQNATDRAERLFRFLLKNQSKLFSDDLTTSDEITFEPYLKNYGQLLDIRDKLNVYEDLAYGFDDVLGMKRLGLLLAGWVTHAPRPSGAELAGSTPGVLVPWSPATTPSGAETAASDAQPKPDEALQKTRSVEQQMLYDLGLGKFAPSTVTPDQTETRELYHDINTCQLLVADLETWILPALYGLLGALVFQLRQMQTAQDKMLPDAPMERLLIRFALGALAGISTTWLFGSTASRLLEGEGTGTTFFGIAFLLGFSIDVFFSILDRLVGFLSESIDKTGKSEPAQPAAR